MWLIYASCALVLGWFGVHDVTGATSYGVRLRASIMILMALYLVLSALAVGVMLRRQSIAAGSVAITGGVIILLTGTALLLYQLTGGDYTGWLLAWIGMALGGSIIALFLFRAGARLPYPKQFAIAVTVTTLLAIANFTYTSLYQPASQPTQFGLEVNIGDPAVTNQKLG
jgi:hypothetical protein